jgi:hypothetical protein
MAKPTTIIGVDTAQWSAVRGNHIVNDDMPRPSIISAVTTATENFAIILGVKVRDRHGSATVELENLILSTTSSAANNVGSLAFSLLESGGVFTNILPPDIFQGTVVQQRQTISKTAGRED